MNIFKNKQTEEPSETLPVGSAALRHAWQTLRKYRDAKRPDDMKIIENERIYRMARNEETDTSGMPKPTSAWLFNCIASKHADMTEAYPTPTVLPREAQDEAEADNLSKLLPVILDRCDFEQTYSDVSLNKLKHGTGVYGVFWDGDENGGLGDITVRGLDIRRLYWEPGITDIQDSANVFYLHAEDRAEFARKYGDTRPDPFIQKNKDSLLFDLPEDRVLVADWYYKKRIGAKTVLHYAKFTQDRLLFATENLPEYKTTGLYHHGRYPFVFDVLFGRDGSPAGFGYIDIGKNAQAYIDRAGEAILQNLLANATPRHFLREDGEVSEKEFADLTRPFIHVRGSLGEDAIRPVQTSPLDSVYMTVLNEKINELKETTGNRDTANGGTVAGVTAASAIAAMQEAGSKLSRDGIKQSYRAFRRICLLCIELIRQFYDLPRQIRILGADGGRGYMTYANDGLNRDGAEPLFDVQVVAEKANPYSKLSQNELALSLYNAGLFDPSRKAEAEICLEMMDFDGKNVILRKIRANTEGEKPKKAELPGTDALTQVRQAVGLQTAGI